MYRSGYSYTFWSDFEPRRLTPAPLLAGGPRCCGRRLSSNHGGRFPAPGFLRGFWSGTRYVMRKGCVGFAGHFAGCMDPWSHGISAPPYSLRASAGRPQRCVKSKKGSPFLISFVLVRPGGSLLTSCVHPPRLGSLAQSPTAEGVADLKSVRRRPHVHSPLPSRGQCTHEWGGPLDLAAREESGNSFWLRRGGVVVEIGAATGQEF